MEEIINNVMQSPENTNPNVLRSQLQNIEGGSGGGGVFVVTFDANNWELKNPVITADKTITEIRNAIEQNAPIIAKDTESTTHYFVLNTVDEYGVVFFHPSSNESFSLVYDASSGEWAKL